MELLAIRVWAASYVALWTQLSIQMVRFRPLALDPVSALVSVVTATIGGAAAITVAVVNVRGARRNSEGPSPEFIEALGRVTAERMELEEILRGLGYDPHGPAGPVGKSPAAAKIADRAGVDRGGNRGRGGGVGAREQSHRPSGPAGHRRQSPHEGDD